jgi:hypothetical protein
MTRSETNGRNGSPSYFWTTETKRKKGTPMIDLEKFVADLHELQEEMLKLGMPFSMLKRIGSVHDILPCVEAAREKWGY